MMFLFKNNYDKILKCRPKSIFDIIPQKYYNKDISQEAHNYIKSGNCYEWYYAIAKTYNPKTYLEIGVRYGYSSMAIIAGAKELRTLYGYDNQSYVNNSNIVAQNNIDRIIKFFSRNTQAIIETKNSQNMQTLMPCDMIHIDGDHSERGCLHDLELALGKCKVIIIDDIKFISDVTRAYNNFLKTHKQKIKNAYFIESFRGTGVIELK